MEIYLENGSEQRKVKAGPALYLLLGLIPLIGGIISLVITIINKQFRGIIVNSWLVVIAYIVAMVISGLVLSLLGTFGIILNLIVVIILFGLTVYFLINTVINANRYSLKQYLEDGYKIMEEEKLSQETKNWIEESKTKEKPFFYFLKF